MLCRKFGIFMNLNFVSYIYVCIMHAYIEFLLISMFHVLKEDSEGGITTFSFQIRTDGLVCPAVAGAPDIADASEVPDTPEAADNNNLCSEAVDQILDGSLCCDNISDAVTVKSALDSTFVCTPYETDCCETNTSANRIFIGESEQLVKFINEIINSTCLVPNCSGKLELHSVEEAGMGGAAGFMFRCTSCGGREVKFNTSSERENGSPALSAALQVAFICAGASYAQYRRVLRHTFGMRCVSGSTFYGRIEEMYEHVKAILDDICLEERQQMKDMDQNELGSWSRAVTCADAVWLTRGGFSRNCTFTVRNYMTGALLYYYHICQKGKDTLCKEDLYEGTSKSAEGFGADHVFSLMAQHGIIVECHIQDGDSTAGNAVLKSFPNCQLLRCGNHVAKNHAVKLEKLRKEKKMTRKDGSVVECYCKGKKHAPNCGCINEKFIRKAKSSFQMCLTNAGKDPNAFSERLLNLALHHYRDVHEWDGGHCDFHTLAVCSCGSCEDKYNFICQGKPYKTGHVLDCPFHSLAYELECQEKAALAHVLIHPEIGKVTTNVVEASHNVLVRYRSKDWHIARLHYQVSTNLGLIQSCMTNLYTKRGPQYHWMLEILKRMGLPVVPQLKYILKKCNTARFSSLRNQKTDAAKAKRKLYKRKRKVDEHKARRLFVQKSAMVHGYGCDEAETPIKKCKCGSTDHKRTTHKSCPLRSAFYGERKSDPAPASDVIVTSSDECLSESDSEQLDYDYEESTDSDDLGVHPCTCPNYPRHKWYCPDNVRNRKRANDGCVTPSGTSWPLSRDNNTHSTPALDVTPSGTLWTPPLKRDLVRCSSPSLLSQDKGQSTPATIASPLSTLLTTPLKPISLALVRCPTPSHVRGQGTPAVNVTPLCTLMTPPLKPIQLVVPKCPSPLIVSQVKGQSTPAVNKSFAQKVHSPTPSSNRTMGHSPVISNIKEQMISPSVSLKRQLKSSEQSDLDCFVDEEKTKCAQKVVHEMLPPPSTNKKWVQEAVAIISKFSGMNVVERKDPVTRIPCSEIAPHIRDEIVGDGACFFRTLSKAITGTQANHYAVRVSLLKFMLHPENVLAFGRMLRQGVVYDLDAQKAVTSHINRRRLYSETAWSTEYEVYAAATMFQVKIKVFSEYGHHRVWHTYVPWFSNKTCMAPMQVMLYLYHINSNHYDLVIPVFD